MSRTVYDGIYDCCAVRAQRKWRRPRVKFEVPLAGRVLDNYKSGVRELGSPIEIMGRIYPTMFHFAPDADPKRSVSDVVDLGIGAYLYTDAGVYEAVSEGLRGRDLHYARLPDVSQAVARKYRDEQGVTLCPESEIQLVGGARAAMALVALRILNPGDRVVIPDPDYVGLGHIARGLGGEIVRAAMRRNSKGALEIDVAATLATISSGCRMIMLTNPNNPTGLAWSRDALNAVSHAARAVGAVMVVNEVYDRLLFAGTRHVTALALDGERDHIVVVNGPGKAYDMTGLALGWVAAAPSVIRPLPDVAFMFQVSGPSIAALHAGLAALSEPMRTEHPRRSVAILQKNAADAAAVFETVPGFHFPQVAGGQFAFPWVGVDDIALCAELRDTAGVALMPGSAWGSMGVGHVRVALANKPDRHRVALERLHAGLKKMVLSNRLKPADPPPDAFTPFSEG